MYCSLDGKWKLGHAEFGEDISGILDRDFVPEGWITANVPEEVHGVLRRNGIIKGHTYHKEGNEELWVEEKDWIYYKEFTAPVCAPGTEEYLVCEGLDTFCEIFLNGESVGRTENMFREYSFEISSKLRPGRNVLILRFSAPAKYVEGQKQWDLFSITTSDRLLARKAQMNYGWDFCGRTVTTGIWKSIGIKIRDRAEIGDFHAETQSADSSRAVLRISARALLPSLPGDGSRYSGMKFRAVLMDGNETAAEAEWDAGAEETGALLEVDSPKIWWPRPYGEQPLYTLKLELVLNGAAVDERTHRIGIRTIELIQEKQADGRSFRFRVNGRDLFLRGSNWVPMKVVYTDIRDEDYEVYLHMAAKGNISMLRIWGGGIYERPRFFELCDELGILVFQDFMFACGIYPQNESFLENVREEVRQAVLRYRNYTCLALWSGDNENGQAFEWAGRNYEFRSEKIGNEVIPSVLKELDPRRPYIPTSPCSPFPDEVGGDCCSSPYQGDQHIYIMKADRGVPAYRDYGKEYYKRILAVRPRFMTEFGFIGLPEKDTFYRFNYLREDIRTTDEIRKHIPMCGKYLDEGNADAAIYYSQLFNSMALKYWIEYFRSLKGICNGALFWKWNDPLADGSDVYLFPSHMCAVDMYQNTRMTYYYTRRAFEDLIVAAVEDRAEENLSVTAVSEKAEHLTGKLRLRLMDFRGNVLWEENSAVTVPGDSACVLRELSLRELAAGRPEEKYLKIELYREGEEYPACENRYYFVEINANDTLTLPESGLRCSRIRRSGTKVELTLESDFFARNVRLGLLDVRADYSDNYFDMDAGTVKTVTVDITDGTSEVELAAKVLFIEAENRKRFTVPLD